MRITPKIARRSRRRGMALLLVMIGMIVCTILTAGFLSSQGTAIGIARNERDASKCRGIAQTGVDMCYWLIRNKPDWRETMTVGTWLNGLAVGDGTLTTSVADGAGNSIFSTDPTQPAVITSTGSYDSRRFSLTATVRPTGAGTVFGNGNFILGNMQVGSDNTTASTVDSFNSSNGSYSAATAASNANFGSNSTSTSALTLYYPSVFKGTYTAAPSATLANAIGLIGAGATAPTSITNASETRTPGTVITPNTSGLTYRGTLTVASGSGGSYPPGRYDQLQLASTGGVTLSTSGLYYFTANMAIAGSSSLAVADGVLAVILVDGTVAINKNVNLNTSGQLAIYSNGSVTISGGQINAAGTAARLIVYGSSKCASVTLSGSPSVVTAIYAPQASVTMQNTAKVYGAIIAHDLTMKSGTQFHFDEALKSLYLSTITGGSAPSGTADYRVTIIGGPGVTH